MKTTWWTRLGESKQDILKRLLKHEHLAPTYRDLLLKIAGMQIGMRIGTLPLSRRLC